MAVKLTRGASGAPSRESTRMVVMALLRRSFKYSFPLRDKLHENSLTRRAPQ
jgi:hypothetical protein